MKTTRRFGWPKSWFRTDRRESGVEAARPVRGRAARLAALAGWAVGEHRAEQLERRQLLFTLTIGPGNVDPQTGLGTVTERFYFQAPHLVFDPVQPMQDVAVGENFDDEMDPWTQGVPPAPPSGTVFDMSNIRISYSSSSTTPVQLIRRVPGGGGQADQALRVALAGTDALTFTFLQQNTTGTGNPPPVSVRNATVDISAASFPLPSDGDGLKTDPNTGSKIELLRNGVVVRTIAGAELAGIATPLGPVTRFTLQVANGFDAFRISSAASAPANGTYADNFVVEAINATIPGGTFRAEVAGSRFYVDMAFTAPAGASIQLLDLFGQDLVQGIINSDFDQTNPVQGSDPNDPDDNGIPNTNIGIGRVIIKGTDGRSALTMIGIRPDGMGGVQYAGPNGFSALFQGGTNNFGFVTVPSTQQDPQVAGLAPVGTSLIIGSPFIPSLTGRTPVADPLDFNRSDQGVFVSDGASMGSIMIWGTVFGSSRVEGALSRWAVGTQYGSLRVDGDLGTFTVQSDAGLFFDPNTNQLQTTTSRLSVGRTVREINVGGRNSMATTVLADVNNPARARINSREFASRERALGTSPTDPRGESLTGLLTFQANAAWASGGQPVPFVTSFYRNDGIASSEFVGYFGTTVRITSTVDGTDTVNRAADRTDVYGFPADNTREVVISVEQITFAGTLRVVDRDGNVLAAFDSGAYGRGAGGANSAARIVRFTPAHADVYYLVINDDQNSAQAPNGAYVVSIAGMAPVTMGEFRIVSGTDQNTIQPFTFSLSAGDAGTFRVGTAAFLGDGSVTNGQGAYFTAQTDPSRIMAWGLSSVNFPGSLYNVLAGGNMDGAQILVRGNIGTVDTGAWDLARSVFNGDMINADIRAGGSIGVMNVRGGMGVRQNLPGLDTLDGVVNIQTGTTAGLRGDIGQIFVGAYVSTTNVTITTSPGSQIDQFVVGSNNDGAGTEHPGALWYGNSFLPPRITVGAGSDVRFLIYRTAGNNFGDVVETIGFGQSRTYVDDAGASVTVSISGGLTPADPTNDPRLGSSAAIRFIPINGSRGVAIARIDTTLLGGADLVINGTTQGVVSIGRIVVANADSGAGGGTGPVGPVVNPSVLITGVAEIDVNRIDVAAGALDTISNTTPNGDVVTIDAAGLRAVTLSGSLGRTQTVASNTEPRGFLMGIDFQNQAGQVGGPLFVNPASINVARAILATQAPYLAPVDFPYLPQTNDSYLSMIGSPIDAHLDGVVVRGGDLESVRANQNVGDVIVQNGHLLSVVANADALTPQGQFQGVVGNIYAPVIGTVDVGDGLRGTGPSPLPAASIAADGAIVSVLAGAGRITGSRLEGYIAARALNGAVTQVGTNTPNPVQLGTPVDAIGTIDVTNGRVDNAFIHAGALDDFWLADSTPDESVLVGTLQLVRSTGGDVLRTRMDAVNLGAVTISGGVWDANLVVVINNIGTIAADSYLNSTRLGEPTEIFANSVTTGNNMVSLITNGLNGDVSDLNVRVDASLTGQIAARNIVRSTIGVSNVATLVRAVNDLRSTTVQAGRLVSLVAGQDIRSVTLAISGPVESVTAGGEITQLALNSSGPDGRLDLLRAQGRITGSVTSSGNIGTIESVTSDIVGSIVTRNDDVRANNGGLAVLRAGGDLDVSASILGDTGTVFARRHIGNINAPGQALDLRGNVGSVTAETGQLYDDLLVGGAITGTVRIGRVSMLPGNDLVGRGSIVAFGRINAIDVQGDFNADIISRSGGIGTITFTSGSFRPGNVIEVTSGSLTQLTFRGGDLLGDVLVDGDIGRIDVLVGPDGFKGQIGVASWRRSSDRWLNDIRHELPPGVERSPQVDGVTIRAGGSIGAVFVERGSMTESQIIAGENIGDVTVVLQLRNDALNTGLNNAIVAGNRIERVTVGGFVGAVAVLAGVRGLGADGRVGGVGDDLDEVGPGSIGSVNFNGPRAVNSVVAAGVAPDPATGRYTTSGALLTTGLSSVDSVNVRGAIVNVVAISAGTLGSTSAGVGRVLTGLGQLEPDLVVGGAAQPGETELVRGAGLAISLPSGDSGTATFSGPGRAFFSPATGTLRLLNTTSATTLVVTAGGATLKNLKIVGNPGSALGTLRIVGTINGNDSRLFVNGGIGTLDLDVIDISGEIGTGLDATAITVNSFLRGTLRARNVGSFTVRGDFGRPAVEGEALADFRSVGSVAVLGTLSGGISSDRTIPSVTLGRVNNGGVRSGGSITTITSGPTLQARFSAAGSIGSVTINGDADETDILGGGDLGRDADFGGDGANADRVFAGSVGTVVVNGNFLRSSVAAGVLPGPTGFFGNGDVVAAGGRGTVGSVTITGTQTGSELGSQQYRVIATGAIGPVRVGGQAFTGAGNFRVERRDVVAVPVQVTDLFVTEASRIYTANIAFNQRVDIATISDALSVFELRNAGATAIGLAEGTDYTLSYDAEKNIVRVIFNRSVTERTLPQTAGVPGPGVYQFVLNAAVLRGSTKDSLLDGDADGVPGDDFSRNAVVGDPGDKITPSVVANTPPINLYGAADLDLVLRRNAQVGSLPDVNTRFTLTGVIGDHPNTDPDVFRVGGDVDVYRISLRAGQVLRLGQVTGVALGVARGLYDGAGNLLAASSATGANIGNPNPAGRVQSVPSNGSTDPVATGEDQFLIRETGTYFIVVAGSLDAVNIADGTQLNNIDPVAGAFGLYSFDVLVFDDQNGGFAGDTASGSGAPLVTPPIPLTFAGSDGAFGTGDDLSSFTQGDWVFTMIPGSGGPNSATTVVRGVNSQGWVVTRAANPNGRFGTVNDRITTTINSSIGLPGSRGVPGDVSPDVDVFLLNGGQPIAQGTRFRVTLRLTETGSDIGLDLRGNAQLALFELPAGTGFANARLVAAPSAFLPIGNQKASTISDGRTSYGYDANGDYFFEFVVPGALGVAGNVPANYALYLQGATRSDYTLEILQQGAGSLATTEQNVLLETKGGVIDWLEAGTGLRTALAAFNAGVVGFTGIVAGLPVETYILNNLVTALNSIFTAANVKINISTDPNAFGRNPFSTVFLAGNVEPNAFFGDGTFGASQRVDAFNASKTDQSVVFVPALATLGFEPTQAGIDQFVQALSAAVARRIGEMVGLRFEGPVTSAATPVPVMASNSVQLVGTSYGFVNQDRPLAGVNDNATATIFYLGNQNSQALIRRIVVPRV